MRRLEIFCVCGYGLGTSMILMMSLNDVFSTAGIDANVYPADITSASGLKADLIFSSQEFFEQLKAQNDAPVVAVTDFLDKKLISEIAIPAVNKILNR